MARGTDVDVQSIQAVVTVVFPQRHVWLYHVEASVEPAGFQSTQVCFPVMGVGRAGEDVVVVRFASGAVLPPNVGLIDGLRLVVRMAAVMVDVSPDVGLIDGLRLMVKMVVVVVVDVSPDVLAHFVTLADFCGVSTAQSVHGAFVECVMGKL